MKSTAKKSGRQNHRLKRFDISATFALNSEKMAEM